MEYNNLPMLSLGILATICWSLSFWSVFKKPELIIPYKKGAIKTVNVKKIILFLMGLTSWGFINFAITEPRTPNKITETNIEVNDIFLVVDVSRSMLAEDFRPNRLEVAKEKIKEFISLMPTDRIGIVLFSNNVYTQMPLTTDLNVLKSMVEKIDIGPLGHGTNIGDAIGLATARLARSESKNKIIILLTDGVSNVGNLTPNQAAEEAKKIGVKMYSIAIGGEEDARIPVGNSIFGTRYAKIPGGSFDLKTLKEISEVTGGQAYWAKNEQALTNVFGEIGKLEKTKIKKFGQIIFKEHYYQYLFIGVILFFLTDILRRHFLKEVI